MQNDYKLRCCYLLKDNLHFYLKYKIMFFTIQLNDITKAKIVEMIINKKIGQVLEILREN
jgi:hypothetical protein